MQDTPGLPEEAPSTGSIVATNSVATTTSPSSGGSNALTIAQLIISGLGVAFALLGAGLLLLIGAVSVFSESGPLQESVPVFGLAWINLLIVLLCAPSLLISIQRLRGKEMPGIRLPKPGGIPLASGLLLVWPLLLLAGNLLVDKSSLAWLLLPPLQILAIGIPIWWLVEIARWKLPASSQQRSWALLDFSLLITTPVVVITEVLLIILLAILVVVWLSGRPDLMQQLQEIGRQIAGAQRDRDAILAALKPFLQNPITVYGAIGLIAGLIPMVEELLKPLAIWPLVGRRISPAQGFVAGALCGAAFALLESLLTLSGAVQDGWAWLVVGRAGTALLHITTTSLVGWGMASAWNNRSYLQLGLAYLFASMLHGMWNGLSILTGLSLVLEDAPANLRWLSGLGKAAPIGLAILIFILFFLLWGNNRRLRAADIIETQTGDPARPLS